MAQVRSGMLPAAALAHMPRLALVEEAQAMDRRAVAEWGLSSRLLMENAAHALANAAEAAWAQLSPTKSTTEARAVVCCGPGNNGGDGYAAARLLANRGWRVEVLRLGQALPGAAAENARAWAHWGNTLDWHAEAAGKLAEADLLIDALFGIGLSRELVGDAAALVVAFNASPARVKLAAELPSGVAANTGEVLGAATDCTHTLSFQTPKPGLYQQPGARYAGKVRVAAVSIPLWWPADAQALHLLTQAGAAALLPQRSPAGHKGTFGHLLCICGQAGMGGAAALAGRAALCAGAGMVTLGLPLCLRDRFLDSAPELITLTPPSLPGAPGDTETHFVPAHASFFLEQAQQRSAVTLGCGLGRHTETQAFVRALVPALQRPCVLDADGLFPWQIETLRSLRAPCVITPHAGEFARLCGISVAQLAADRLGYARRAAQASGAVVVLKGPATLIAAPEGEAFLNTSGNEALATAGTGDVLAGMIGSLLAQGLAPLRAALLGVYWHGLAQQLDPTPAACFHASLLLHGLAPALRSMHSATRFPGTTFS